MAGDNKSSNKSFSTLNLNQKVRTRSEQPATGSQAASLAPGEPLILKSDNVTPEESGILVRTNMISTRNNGLIMATQPEISMQHPYFSVWDDESRNLWNHSKAAEKFKLITKDYDFGDPSRRKKIYKIYVTFRCNQLISGVRVKYATNGSTTFGGTFADGTYYTNAKGLDSYNAGTTSEDWITAELKPSSSINNIYSFALQFDFANAGRTNRLAASSAAGSNSITLDSSASSTDDYYNGMPIYFYGGSGSGGRHRIIDYTGSTKVATITPALSNPVDTTTLYDVGFIPASFQINDISIIYRQKGIK